MTQQSRKKLIEVALPLPEINDASAYDKMPGIGPHPKGIHHWWARLPLPTARAVLFASIVDDPACHPDRWATEELQNKERERLFDILRLLSEKRLHERPDVYHTAYLEMLKYCDGDLPTVLDPFSGGGSIPLEANRLGFPVFAGDLNPVAVLLNKCNLELAPRWSGLPPVNPKDASAIGGRDGWQATFGLAADIRYYGGLIESRARETLGQHYPALTVTKAVEDEQPELKGYLGKTLPVITWLWARTVPSPNPAVQGTHVPLISTFWLSNKDDKRAWLSPQINKRTWEYSFQVRTDHPEDPEAVALGTKSRDGGFKCILTGDPIPFSYIREQGRRGALGATLLAEVVELKRGRAFVQAQPEHARAALCALPDDVPDTDLPTEALGFRIQNYGIRKHRELFTNRQLVGLTTLSNLIRALGPEIESDCARCGMPQADASDYARTVVTFLALALDRCTSFNNAFCKWNGSQTVFMFTKQAIPMLWDYSEANLLGKKAVCWSTAVDICAEAVETIRTRPGVSAAASIRDAAAGASFGQLVLVSTDPPYYDNIGYAALSDIYYIWLRRTLRAYYPELFNTVLVPKKPELTASPELFDGDKVQAKRHFENGFRSVFSALRSQVDSRFPMTVYYAFKQDDEAGGAANADEEGDASPLDLTTGWETLLEALISSGFCITATWPLRASFKWRTRALKSNALASYIVLACRPRGDDAPQIDRRSFIAELKRELPAALRHLQQGNIAPVDFAQAALGPGMAVFSKYGGILESTGRAMSVRSALSVINQTLTEVLSEQEDEFDPDTRWAVAWFEQNGFDSGSFGDAELLSKAKVTSVAGLQQAGIVVSRAGDVRLLRPSELPDSWDPTTDKRLTIWEVVHHLIRALSKGEDSAARLVRKLGSNADIARELAYRLFDVCEKRKRTQEAFMYNSLVMSWPEVARLAREVAVHEKQSVLFGED